MYKPKLEKDIRCPLEYALDVFGGKWKSRIICALGMNTTMRYSELRGELSNITDTMLANSLKELQDKKPIPLNMFVRNIKDAPKNVVNIKRSSYIS